jgi:glutamyl-tRNA synthetase
VDDYETGVTHIIRGEDHIPNTPRHIILQEALGFNVPNYAHLPLILAPDKSKLSKRHGAVSVSEYKNMGYLPEAIINFIAFIGWNPGGEKEIFSKDELIKEFSLERIQKSAGIFNIERLNWYNGQYIRKTEPKKLAENLLEYLPEDWKKNAIENFSYWLKIVELAKNRIAKLADIKEGNDYFFNEPEYAEEMLLWKKDPDMEKTKKHLEEVVNLLSAQSENEFNSDKIKEAIWNYAEKEGRGNVLWPTRVALTGLEKSPDPFAVAEVLGKEKTIQRLKYAIGKI